MPNRSDTTDTEDQRRLDSWKEIGAFFGKDERTVKRWETGRGLPVHRMPGSGRRPVYAYAWELEKWLRSAEPYSSSSPTIPQPANLNPATDPPLLSPSAAPSSPIISHQTEATPAPAVTLEHLPASFHRRRSTVVTALLLALLMAVVIPVAVSHRIRRSASPITTPPAKHIPNSEAQEFYLKGEYYLQKRTAESLSQAVDNFTQAIVRDPAYAEAYAGLANCYNLLREYTLMPADEAYPRALAAAKQGLALDSSLAGAHSSLAFVDSYWLWDKQGAEKEFKRAIELDPNSASSHHWYATFLLHLARYSESLTEIDRAQVLDPSSISILADKGLILFCAGQQERAIPLLKQLEVAEPAFLSPHSYLASIDMDLQRYPEYLDEANQAATLVRDADRSSVVTAGEEGYRHAGAQGLLEAMLHRQQSLFAEGKWPAYPIAQTYARLGRQQQALEYLQIACKRKESGVSSLRVDRAFQPLHSNLEFRRMLAQTGLPPVLD